MPSQICFAQVVVRLNGPSRFNAESGREFIATAASNYYRVYLSNAFGVNVANKIPVSVELPADKTHLLLARI